MGIVQAMYHLSTQLVHVPLEAGIIWYNALSLPMSLQVSIQGVFVLTRQESVNNVIVSATHIFSATCTGVSPSQTRARLCRGLTVCSTEQCQLPALHANSLDSILCAWFIACTAYCSVCLTVAHSPPLAPAVPAGQHPDTQAQCVWLPAPLL